MKHHIAATALAATIARPAAAVTFPSLTTIYVGSGVYDDGGAANSGIATSIPIPRAPSPKLSEFAALQKISLPAERKPYGEMPTIPLHHRPVI